MEVGQVHHIEYYLNDLDRCISFWEPLLSELNYKEFSRFADGISWKHKNGTYLVFVQVKDEYLNHTNNRQASGLNHIAFQGASEAQLDHIQTLVISLGGKILKRAEAYLCFEDPNLFAVEVYAP